MNLRDLVAKLQTFSTGKPDEDAETDVVMTVECECGNIFTIEPNEFTPHIALGRVLTINFK